MKNYGNQTSKNTAEPKAQASKFVMTRIFYKPLSANETWRGRRFKSDKYKQFERDMLYQLPKIEVPEPPYALTLAFGFSNPAADIDNPAKCLIDVLQKKYSINDKHIYELHIYKEITPNGKEYIEFEIKARNPAAQK